MSPEPQAGSSGDVFVDRLTELLDAHVVRPRPAADEATSDEGAQGVGAAARGSTAAEGAADAGAAAEGAAVEAAADEGAADAADLLLATLRAGSTWGEPPAGLRDIVLARVLGTPAGDEPEAPSAPGAAAADPAAAGPGAPAVDSPVGDAPAPAGSPAAAPTEPAEPDEDLPLAAVHELRPRRLRLRYAVPLAAAAAAVFTVSVIGIQQALAPEEPGGVTFSAVGTQFAPRATGTVTVAKAAAGFRVVIDVKNLPAAQTGSYYIAWLRGPNGVVPLGSFHARQVAKPVTLWSGVDPADYPRFSVTLQREGAPPTPSGVVVMSGNLPGK